MRVLEGDPSSWPTPERRAAATIGVYDGVHLGHQRVFADLHSRAVADDLAVTVVTFRDHPATVLAPDRVPPLLTTLHQRMELFAALGVDQVALMDFDDELRHLPASDFVESILVGGLDVALVAVGEEFRFGYQQQGDIVLLTSLGLRMGFEVVPIRLHGDDRPFSSTRIRTALARGDLRTAERLLGRPFRIEGTVIEGAGRGRALGFPTANLRLAPHQAVPAHGVYAVRVGVVGPDGGGTDRPGVANIGVRPTFGGVELVVEVHLLGTTVDLYGSELTVELVERIRDERRFDGVDALTEQIAADVDAARAILAADQTGVESIS